MKIYLDPDAREEGLSELAFYEVRVKDDKGDYVVVDPSPDADEALRDGFFLSRDPYADIPKQDVDLMMGGAHG